MTVRGVARLAGYLAATTCVGLAILVRDTLRDLTRAVRLPAHRREVDDLLAGYQPHAWPDDPPLTTWQTPADHRSHP